MPTQRAARALGTNLNARCSRRVGRPLPKRLHPRLCPSAPSSGRWLAPRPWHSWPSLPFGRARAGCGMQPWAAPNATRCYHWTSAPHRLKGDWLRTWTLPSCRCCPLAAGMLSPPTSPSATSALQGRAARRFAAGTHPAARRSGGCPQGCGRCTYIFISQLHLRQVRTRTCCTAPSSACNPCLQHSLARLGPAHVLYQHAAGHAGSRPALHTAAVLQRTPHPFRERGHQPVARRAAVGGAVGADPHRASHVSGSSLPARVAVWSVWRLRQRCSFSRG